MPKQIEVHLSVFALLLLFRPRNVPATGNTEYSNSTDCYDQDLMRSPYSQDHSELLKPLLSDDESRSQSIRMSVAVVNSSTVTKFVDDTDTFDSFVNIRFAMVDENGDGMLSRDEIRGGLGSFMPLGSESQPQQEIDSMLGLIFERFDEDRNGALDLKEFKSLMTEIMHSLARGIGGSPIIVALEQGSLLMTAVQHELATHPSPS